MDKVYFIGIGGIGMSALARYFKAKGYDVQGYDRTETALTHTLVDEGIAVHYTDSTDAIPPSYKENKENVLVIYTPAVPAFHSEMSWFRRNEYRMMKRSQVLGMISEAKKTIAVAGTHGKTSVSAMTSFLLTETGIGCDAFLGGISRNYQTNLLLCPDSPYTVAEADEYDRSFLWLHPYIAVVTAMDADHLDIYGTHKELKKAFGQFVSQITADGCLIVKYGLDVAVPADVRKYTYALDNPQADFYARNIRCHDGMYHAELCCPEGVVPFRANILGRVNMENSVAAMATSCVAGASMPDLAHFMEAFAGVQRRFDYRVKRNDRVYIDDYGHHPEELRYTIQSVRELYPEKQITGIFQPHLYTRTRDFAEGFAQSLSMLDKLILLDIYPAREEPIPGISSQIIFDRVTIPHKQMCRMEDVIGILSANPPEVLLTMGAGDIDTLVAPVENLLKCL
ncbi:MAG: UDP-N-acetylmuramate--L-alanine ligase [Bacteroidales bacterium]|nr:UDP-N-acetylmuramate--L-alanine ligase [Bacteroidales bacterium]